jgi:hypothetical protein
VDQIRTLRQDRTLIYAGNRSRELDALGGEGHAKGQKVILADAGPEVGAAA